MGDPLTGYRDRLRPVMPEEEQVRERIDDQAYYLAQTWYLHPDFSDLGYYNGICLGELVEYGLIPMLISVMKKTFDDA